MMRSETRWVLAVLVAAAGCGGEVEPELAVAFRTHALECTTPFPMQARLEVSGVPGVCLLEIDAEGRATGACRGIPTGEERVFRLVYYVEDPAVGDAVEVATVAETYDLRDPPGRTVRIEFSASALFYPDTDRDGRGNLWEYCNGRSPVQSDCASDPQPACGG
jgi:hypothetical protein